LKSTGIKKIFTRAERQGVLKLIASADGRESSLPIQQDIQMYSTFINDGNHMIHEISPGRSAWLHVVKGGILLNDLRLQTGDGAGISHEIGASFTAKMPAEILLFDLCKHVTEETKKDPQNKLQTAGLKHS
jgi:redox-sensitive bicupin YhaK (pirin superfamily)